MFEIAKQKLYFIDPNNAYTAEKRRFSPLKWCIACNNYFEKAPRKINSKIPETAMSGGNTGGLEAAAAGNMSAMP